MAASAMQDVFAPLQGLSPDARFAELVALASTECAQTDTRPQCQSILLEGLDGVGKSTLAAALASKLNATLLCTPPMELHPYRAFFDQQPEAVRRAFYMLGNLLVSRVIRSAKAEDKFVIDRYWPSTFAYGTASKLRKERCPIDEIPTQTITWPSFLCAPTSAILLTLDEHVRQQRLCARGAQTQEEEHLQREREFRALVMTMYRRIPGFIELDSTHPVDALVESVVKAQQRSS